MVFVGMIEPSYGARDAAYTMLPQPLIEPLRAHLVGVKALHERDIVDGCGDVELPDAIARKYPRAPYEWGWNSFFLLTSVPSIRASLRSGGTTSMKTIWPAG